MKFYVILGWGHRHVLTPVDGGPSDTVRLDNDIIAVFESENEVTARADLKRVLSDKYSRIVPEHLYVPESEEPYCPDGVVHMGPFSRYPDFDPHKYVSGSGG